MDEDEMTYDELRAAMLSGRQTSVNPGPRPVLVGPVLLITSSTLPTEVTVGQESRGPLFSRPRSLSLRHAPLRLGARLAPTT
jgi:hypothetical protein